MGNWKLTRSQEPQALTEPVLREMRRGQVGGLTRRQLIRRSIGAAVGLWVLEVTAGTLGFLWPNLARGFGGQINLGSIDVVNEAQVLKGLSLADGSPSYFPQARTYVQLIDTSLAFQNGESPDGSGTTTNVRTMWQKCPHLGCKPNFCDINYWFECPCHGSRYDRLGTKVQELGPAPRGLDRFAHVVQNGELIVDTSKVTLGPLPVALGQPGLIPAKSPVGCI
jgi:cytochrome b6-f complex iron-sulfur subunit